MENQFLRQFAQKAKRRLVGREVSNAKIKVISGEDENFKGKVKDLLSQEEIVTNPAHFLMDEKTMKHMTDEEKERYLLTTLDKYNALRHELEHDNADTRFCI